MCLQGGNDTPLGPLDAADPDSTDDAVVDEGGGHTPVLPREVMALLAPSAGETLVDLTVGLGGHALLLGAALGAGGRLIGIDADPANLSLARERLQALPCRVDLVHANFSEARRVLLELGGIRADVMLADLGVSSTQLDQAPRGFSFLRDGPLDMRMDPRLTTTAAELVNRMKERELSDLFYYNAQEPQSRRMAQAICDARRDARITTTGRLVEVISAAVGVNPLSRKSKLHPATRVFQALRIAVNDEIGNLQTLLDDAPRLLQGGGRFGVIAFHSVEDKVVKTDMRRRKTEGLYRIVTKKPVVALEDERRDNPRSRSAKFRVVERLPEGDAGGT